MPDLTAEDIATAATKPQSASVDGQAASAHSIPDQLKALDRVEGEEAFEGTNQFGGPVSGFSKLRMARARNCGGPQ